MTDSDRFSAEKLADAMRIFRDALAAHREEINALNVFPVPDGDTGSNMASTINAAVNEMDENGGSDTASVASSISKGALLGARGNSGVILSQLLRGFMGRVDDEPEASARDIADALVAASEAAYKAVGTPVEGTVLTVARVAAEQALTKAEADGTIVEVLEAAAVGAKKALDETPEQLEDLKKAGVVDAGGAGFKLFFDSMLNAIDGRPIPEPEAGQAGSDPTSVAESVNHSHEGETGYEVMFILEEGSTPRGGRPLDERIDEFREGWGDVGNSVVVVGGDGLYNCHIHTEDIGAAIEYALDFGRPRDVKVTNLDEQIAELRGDTVDLTDSAGDSSSRDFGDVAGVATAVICVANGDGIARVLRSLGVHVIVAGGQSMNPSTAQLVAAVESAPSDNVIILPSNRNIVPVAEHVDAVTNKTVGVVPTNSIPQTISALFDYDGNLSLDANVNAMMGAKDRVRSGEVTFAVRDAKSDVGDVAEGQCIGIYQNEIVAIGSELVAVSCDLLKKMIDGETEVVTLFAGADSDASSIEAIEKNVSSDFPNVAVEVVAGGQPLYPLLIGVE